MSRLTETAASCLSVVLVTAVLSCAVVGGVMMWDKVHQQAWKNQPVVPAEAKPRGRLPESQP